MLRTLQERYVLDRVLLESEIVEITFICYSLHIYHYIFFYIDQVIYLPVILCFVI